MKSWPLLMLLCLSIPLQGMAAARSQRCQCPMEMSQEMSQETSQQMSAAMQQTYRAATPLDPVAVDGNASNADPECCCNDAATAERTSQACKVGQDFRFS